MGKGPEEQRRELGTMQGYRIHRGTHQPRTHDRRGALRAGPGRVAGTASGRGLLAFPAGGAWDGSPGTLVQDSWGPPAEAEGKGCEPR